MTSKFWLTNLVLFQLAWLCCALLTANASWLTPLIVALHFALSPTKRSDAKLLPFALFGCVIDYILFQLNVISFAAEQFPLWLLCLWVMFVLSINHSLSWLGKCKLWLVAIIGAFGGALSYLGALNFSAIITSLSQLSLFTVYAIIWALLLPALIVFKQRLVESKHN